MDIVKILNRSGKDKYMILFPSALKNNDFHMSFHDESYGLHFKIHRPYSIQSEAIKYEELIDMMKTEGPKVLNHLIRLPKKEHEYTWFITQLDQTQYDKVNNQKSIKIKAPVFKRYEIVEKKETHFIPKDFLDLKKVYKGCVFSGYVPDTNESFHFLSLSDSEIRCLKEYFDKYLPDCLENFDHELYLKLGGVFITIDLNNDTKFIKESMPHLFEVTTKFLREVENKNLELYDQNKLGDVFNFMLF